jgi:pSer/pThr/pTyr-binding forkhead associated (FHA) protein
LSLASLVALASSGLEDFLEQLSYPVFLTGPYASTKLNDPALTEETTLSGEIGSQARGMVVPVRARAKAKAPAGELLVGRSIGCDILLPFVTVSRVHAKLNPGKAGEVMLSDAGSRNGTWVNNVKVEAGQEVPLQDDALVRLGMLESRFLLPETLYWYLQGATGK